MKKSKFSNVGGSLYFDGDYKVSLVGHPTDFYIYIGPEKGIWGSVWTNSSNEITTYHRLAKLHSKKSKQFFPEIIKLAKQLGSSTSYGPIPECVA